MPARGGIGGGLLGYELGKASGERQGSNDADPTTFQGGLVESDDGGVAQTGRGGGEFGSGGFNS